MASDTYQGWAGPASFIDERNARKFEIDRAIARISTSTLVKIVSGPYDTNGNAILPGTPGAVGYVDVQPLVNQLDGLGNPMPHGVVYHCSYKRHQGGSSSLIIDPVVGDIGKFVVADRDTSAVKASGQQSNPGSLRRYNKADGTYIGLTQGGAPTSYISFTSNGIIWRDAAGNSFVSVSDTNINAPTVNAPTQWCGFTANGFEIHDKSGNSIIMNSSGIFLNGAKITSAGDVISKPNSISLDQHQHSQGVDSHGDTEVNTNAPVPGT